MDPFTAVGLAGNIITFVEFTWKLLSGAHAIYQSGSGISDGNAVLQTIARHVKSLTELLEALEKLKVKGPNSRWKSLKAALKDAWSRDEIDSLEQRLSQLQAQTMAHMQYQMGNKMSEMSVAVNGLVETNNLLRLDMRKLATMDRMMKDILQTTTALQSADADRHQTNDATQALSLAILRFDAHGRAMACEQHLLGSLHFPMLQARHEKIETAHANTYEWIFEHAMPDTTEPIGFAQWLEQGNGIFWIYGKPGCGKSTLMKFICSHDRTREHLSRWAEHHPKVLEGLCGAEAGQASNPTQTKTRLTLTYEADLVKSYNRQQSWGNEGSGGDESEISKLVTAKYFFWNAGFRLQKSQDGLLRSLLLDVLRQCPELVGHVLRTRSSYGGFPGPAPGETPPSAATASWSFEELLLTLEDAINVRVSATFCLFIDGLDEFQEENKQTYRDLIDTLDRITKLPNAKICTSSRPWTVFQDAFQKTSAYSLKLEDLTRRDIRRYVSDKFEQHDQYIRLKAHDPGYENLVEAVATRAQGVFLWVYLVVRDLLEGFTYNDSVQTMLQRLDQFPADLEDFFQHMIECIPALYRRQAARTFIITMEAPHPLLLTLHSFLDDIEADPQFCVSRAQGPFPVSELAFRHERMRRQLEGRTKGLLEVVREPAEAYFASRVDFLHRTVRDFLRSSSKVQSLMTNGQEDVSGTWVLLCRGILAEIRYAPFMAVHQAPAPGEPVQGMSLALRSPGLDNRWLGQFLQEFAYFAEKALGDANNTSIIIESFKAMESALARTKVFAEQDPDIVARVVCTYGPLELLKQMDYDWSRTSRSGPHDTPTVTVLLRKALMEFAGPAERQHDIVTYLLGRGANPNWRTTLKSDTPFQEYMSIKVMGHMQEQKRHHIFRIILVLVEHGADLSDTVESRYDNREIAVEDAIRRRFGPELASRILDSALHASTATNEQQQTLASRAKKPANPGIKTGSSNQPQPQGQAQTAGHRAAFRSKLRRLLRR